MNTHLCGLLMDGKLQIRLSNISVQGKTTVLKIAHCIIFKVDSQFFPMYLTALSTWGKH